MDDLYRTLFEYNPDAVLIIKTDGSILAANPPACRAFVSTQPELLRCGLSGLLDLNNPVTSAALIAQIERAPYHGELTFERKDGSTFSASVIGVVHPSAQGEPKMVLFIRDITQTKQTQLELFESEEPLHQLISVLRVAVWIQDASTRKVLYVNPAFEEIFGLPREVFYEDPEVINKSMHPDDQKWFQQNTLEYSDEFRIVRPDGAIRWVWGRKFPVRNAAGEIYRTGTIMEDITDRRGTEEKLIRAYFDLQRQMEEIIGLQSTLRELAIRDPLTGLFNRRHLDETLEREIDKARRQSGVISLIMIDIDNFKMINDIYGHQTGDQVLQVLAQLLKQHIRSQDIACRYAGDEFMILLPDTPVGTAYQRAEILRAAFQSEIFRFAEAQIHSTLSIGIAQFPTHGANSQEVLRTVDNAMYDAKAKGKNRVVIWDEKQI